MTRAKLIRNNKSTIRQTATPPIGYKKYSVFDKNGKAGVEKNTISKAAPRKYNIK
jgi:hypothetical protein